MRFSESMFVGALALVLVACPSNVKRCKDASDCTYPGSVCQDGLCVLATDAGAAGGSGGGTTGGGAGGGATGGGAGGGATGGGAGGGATGGGTGGTGGDDAGSGGGGWDAGADAGSGTGSDAGFDAGPPPCTTNASCGGGANVCGSDGVLRRGRHAAGGRLPDADGRGARLHRDRHGHRHRLGRRRAAWPRSSCPPTA